MRRGRDNKPTIKYVPLIWNMLNHKAYKKLPPSSAKALPYFLGKVKLWFDKPERYSQEFHFSYSEGKRLEFASSTFSKIIQDLVSYGFIDPVDKGGLRGCGRSFSIFKLSMRWEDYGTDKFKSINWKCFSPRDQRQLQKVKCTTSESEIREHV